MGKFKTLFNVLDGIAASFLGVALLDLFSIFTIENVVKVSAVDQIDAIIKTLMAFAGLVYFIAKGVHNNKMNKLDRETKQIENLKLREELEAMELDNDEKKSTN